MEKFTVVTVCTGFECEFTGTRTVKGQFWAFGLWVRNESGLLTFVPISWLATTDSRNEERQENVSYFQVLVVDQHGRSFFFPKCVCILTSSLRYWMLSSSVSPADPSSSYSPLNTVWIVLWYAETPRMWHHCGIIEPGLLWKYNPTVDVVVHAGRDMFVFW